MAKQPAITGTLRERLTLQYRTTSQDAIGGDIVSWSTYATVWGSVRALSAAEALRMQSITATQQYEVRVRYNANIVPTMRISWTPYLAASAKSLEIHGVMPDPQAGQAYMLLSCGAVDEVVAPAVVESFVQTDWLQ